MPRMGPDKCTSYRFTQLSKSACSLCQFFESFAPPTPNTINSSITPSTQFFESFAPPTPNTINSSIAPSTWFFELFAPPTPNTINSSIAPSTQFFDSFAPPTPNTINSHIMTHHDFSALCIPCTKSGCNHWFKNRSGHTQHMNVVHPMFAQPSASIQPHARSPGPVPPPPNVVLDSGDAMDFGDDEDPLQPAAEFVGAGSRLYRNYHPFLSARPCDDKGNFLAPGTPPQPLSDKASDDWSPYGSRVEFELADYLFTKNQTLVHSINQLLNIWAASLIQAGCKAPPFADYHDVYKTIDNTPLGEVKWQSFSVKFTGAIPDEGAAPWMTDSHDVWFRDPHDVVRNMLSNPDYATKIDLQPYCEFATENDERQWQDFMSGDWAWSQADKIAEDAETHGSTFVPIILGSDKTTISVATGQNDYYTLYTSIGNGFLQCLKHAETASFRNFRRQIFHSSLSFILKNLKPGMIKPEVVHFGDGHYHCVMYGLGPYITDYEEQVLLAYIVRNWCAKCLSRHGNLDEINLCRSRLHADAPIEECDHATLWDEYGIVRELVLFTNDFPRADIHELLALDILHQIIKGAYKDHLSQANIILDDIDRRIATVPSFPGLCRFPQGRHFKQWTGDDLKALMKVCLPAIEGYVPTDVVRTFRAFLKFCYLVRRNIITETSLNEIQDALTRFHRYREIFKTTGVVLTFSLPQQHSMTHYAHLIRLFGAPNGLCSSITESKHIKAVKEPWRQSSRYEALGQMLQIKQQLDKLAASHIDFCSRGMLSGTCLSAVLTTLEPMDERPAAPASAEHAVDQYEPPSLIESASILDADVSADSEDIDEPTSVLAHVQLARTSQGKKRSQSVPALADELNIPNMTDLVQQFLVEQLYPDNDAAEAPFMECLHYEGRIRIFNSVVLMFFAPSDLSGIGGMKQEHIRASPKWRSGYACKDCVFVITDPDAQGMRGMDIAQVLTFFSFRLRGRYYPCAVVRWFNRIGDAPDDETGMWMVKPSSIGNCRHFAVIHIDSIFRSAHLIPVYGTEPLPSTIKSHHILDVFTLFYVNRYADHHAFKIAS
ncbi:uncharacterized protein EDB91DRAFT_1284709 [Suillus paluster]|uniref:uncharacterized protein n=1 Tax=Suillus paluster TaxID=48578 RepID=UPI001B862164|nr:uncharacterized protein EDB91DRAFT_1284709 [Suillus paluster]KAG1719820.1 hypothetical protein EDB91DRAFT_1284709 [Suillus paluster]